MKLVFGPMTSRGPSDPMRPVATPASVRADLMTATPAVSSPSSEADAARPFTVRSP
jgi:hypothetical protein